MLRNLLRNKNKNYFIKLYAGEKISENFLWGVAYSSHQVEGNNRNNDRWAWEEKGKTAEKSGWACDS